MIRSAGYTYHRARERTSFYKVEFFMGVSVLRGTGWEFVEFRLATKV